LNETRSHVIGAGAMLESPLAPAAVQARSAVAETEKMEAIVKISGKQYRVAEGDRLTVDRLATTVGDKVTFDQVLLLTDGARATVGAPVVDGAAVTATVVAATRGPKLIVYKYKAKKRYRRTQGARAEQSLLEVLSVRGPGSRTKPGKAESAAPKAETETTKAEVDAPKTESETTKAEVDAPKTKTKTETVKAEAKSRRAKAGTVKAEAKAPRAKATKAADGKKAKPADEAKE
jgi:large subunit ribosomal protein L21